MVVMMVVVMSVLSRIGSGIGSGDYPTWVHFWLKGGMASAVTRTTVSPTNVPWRGHFSTEASERFKLASRDASQQRTVIQISQKCS